MTAMHRPFRRRGGFTLIEGVVAAVVFLLGMLALMGAFLQARRANANARRELLASAVLTDMAEQINTWTYTDPRLSLASGWCADPKNFDAQLSNIKTFKANADACMNDEADLKTVTATTGWGGLASSQFPAGPSDMDAFYRYYVVQELSESGSALAPASVNSGVRKVIWATVLYAEGGDVRRAVTQVVKVRQAGLKGF
jgi:Tfp pilus assembly protein PilV